MPPTYLLVQLSRCSTVFGAVSIACVLMACGGPDASNRPTEGDQDPNGRLLNADAEPRNWLMYNGNYRETRYSSLDQINTDTVSDLGLAWFFEYDTARGQEATPLVVDGVMYTTIAWNKVYAIDAKTGGEIWYYDPEVPGVAARNACCDVINRGAAFYDGKIYTGTIDGRLIALDAQTGEEVWSTVTVDQSKPYTITGAPRIANGKVYIGNGGAEYGVRGYVSAYDAQTGERVWRFYTVPGEPGVEDGAASDDILARLASETWAGDVFWTIGGGGTVWDSIVYDPELHQLYIGVGNGGPWDHVIRSEGKGDNLFLASVIALNPDTGDYIWHYQQNPGETWDFTSTQQITLTEMEFDGQVRKVILHAPKNGFFYVIDRTTGKLLSAEKFADVNWAERIDLETGRPVEHPNARFLQEPFFATSGSSGAHNWHPMSYDEQSGLVYIPAQQVPLYYVRDDAFDYVEGLWALGIDLNALPFPTTADQVKQAKDSSTGHLLAWDPAKSEEVWRVEHGEPWNGGVLSTAGGIVMQGLKNGDFNIYRADNGEKLWSFDAQTSILAAPVSYAVDGEQYIALSVGDGSTLALPAWDGPSPKPFGRMLAFKLGGREELPEVTAEVPPIENVTLAWSDRQIETGRSIYNRICSACHGAGTLSGGVIPDLKRSVALGDGELWNGIVIEGVLQPRGMPSFAQFISEEESEAVRAYVAKTARQYLEQPIEEEAKH